MIPQESYKKRRETLMEKFEDKDCSIFLKGKSRISRNTDVNYPFRQDSHVFYLSGINMPDVSLLLLPQEHKYVLFAPETTMTEEMFTGKKPSLEELKEIYLADEIYSSDRLDEIMKKHKCRSTYSLPELNGAHRYRHKRLRDKIIAMRSIKNSEEIDEIEKALEITAKTYDIAMRMTRPGINEAEVQAAIEFIYRSNGVTYAFPPIVTINGNVLHSENNNNMLEDGRLLLMDSGAEFGCYAADITRTFPVNGKFSPEQKALYNVVLEAQTKAIEKARPGIALKDLDKIAEEIIAYGLKDAGILKGNMSPILEKEIHRVFYPHGLGHAVGLDVHDCTDFQKQMRQFKNKQLQPGNVFTIEPGIYFIDALLNNPEIYEDHKEHINMDKAKQMMNTVSGIRIEDDILITKDGCRVLGKTKIPKEVDQLERIVGSRGVSLI